MIYFIVLGVLFSLAWLDNSKSRNAYIAIAFLVLLLFLGARWETGTDWGSYIEFFQDLDNYRSFEPGYVILNEAVRLFTASYTIFLFVNGALALAPIAFFIRKEARGSVVISVGIFYAYYYLITYFGATRRIIAIGLCVLAAMCLLQKRRKIALALILAGACFHYSAMLCLIYFPLERFRPSLRDACRFAVLAGLTIILLYAATPLLMRIGVVSDIFVRVGEYLIGDTSVEGYDRATLSILSIAKRSLFIVFVAYSVIKNRSKIGPHDMFYANCYFFSFVIYLLSEFVIGDIFKTFTIYFSIFEIALMPNLIRTYKARWRFILYCLFVPYVILQTYSATYGNPFVDMYIPYRLSPNLDG